MTIRHAAHKMIYRIIKLLLGDVVHSLNLLKKEARCITKMVV